MLFFICFGQGVESKKSNICWIQSEQTVVQMGGGSFGVNGLMKVKYAGGKMISLIQGQ